MVPFTWMSLGARSGQASAASNSLRDVTVTVRAAVAAEPPVVPWGKAAVATDAQPSFGGRTSRPGSMEEAAQALPNNRKPMDSEYARIRARHGKNIHFPHEKR
jgi:hypothetical protein